MSFCTQCGRESVTGRKFCTGCGAPLPPATPAPAGGSATVPRAAGPPPPVHEPPPPVYEPPPTYEPAPSPYEPPTVTWPPPGENRPGAAAPQPAPSPAGPATRTVTPTPPGARPRGRRPILIAAVVAVLAVAGGVAGWLLAARHPGRVPAAAQSARQIGRPVTSRPASPSVPASSAPPSPQTSTLPAPGGPGSVAIAPSLAAQGNAAAIAAFLTSYFTAINAHDYNAYISLFDSRRQPIPSIQQFRAGYRTTADSHATLVGISPAAAGPVATVTFISHQSPADSASQTACTSWRIRLYLESAGGSYLIGKSPPGYHARFAACG
jgi:hypothetical protein